MNDFFLQELEKLRKNDEQYEAYLCSDNCVVQAGPGSGKTATLTMKIIKLLHEDIISPRGLACLTFNNEAVREFKNRLRLLGYTPKQNVFLGTLHSFCLSSVIRPFAKLFINNFPDTIRIASQNIQNKFLQKAMDKHGITEKTYVFRPRMDRYRRTFIDRDKEFWTKDDDCAYVISIYEELLRSNSYFDFDDLILIALHLINSYPFVRKCISARYPWFVIDEYQDLGYPLHRIVLNLLEKTDSKIFAVGDPDQSIYGFAGANPKYLAELSDRSDVKPIRLRLNYRCGQHIINGAERVLDLDEPRNYRSNRGDRDVGEIYFYECPKGLRDQIDTIVKGILPEVLEEGYEPKDIAILYLDRNDAKVITEILDENEIQYSGERDQRYPRTPFTRWLEEIAQWSCGQRGKKGIQFRGLWAVWFKMLKDAQHLVCENKLSAIKDLFVNISSLGNNPNMSLHDWLNRLDERLNLKGLLSKRKQYPEELESFSRLIDSTQTHEPLENSTLEDFAGCGPNTNRISLTTLHSSKGLQYDVVIIPGLEEGRIPRYNATTADAIREARRVFYVAFTRARYLVYLLYSGSYENAYGRSFKKGPSRFVTELEDLLGVED